MKSHGYSPSVYIVRGKHSSVVETELAYQYPGSRFSPSLAVKTIASVKSLAEKKNETESENRHLSLSTSIGEQDWWARKDGGQIRRQNFAEKQYLPNLIRISKLLITNLNNNIKQYCLHREDQPQETSRGCV